jgi:hypothetical protein
VLQYFSVNFNLPLSVQAHQQFLVIQNTISILPLLGESDLWTYIW